MNRRLHFRFNFGLNPVCLLVMTAAIAGSALAQRADAAFELQSGVVIDKDSGIAFVMSTKGGSDALDIASGEILWHSNRAGRPLAVIDDKLVAQVESTQAGRLELAVFELVSGALLKTATTMLPADMVASISDGMGSSFRSWAEVQGGQLAIGWEASTKEIKGTGSGSLQRSTDAALLDLSSGSLNPSSAMPARPQRDKEMQSSNRLAAASGRQFLSSDGQHILASELLPDRWGYRWKERGQCHFSWPTSSF